MKCLPVLSVLSYFSSLVAAQAEALAARRHELASSFLDPSIEDCPPALDVDQIGVSVPAFLNDVSRLPFNVNVSRKDPDISRCGNSQLSFESLTGPVVWTGGPDPVQLVLPSGGDTANHSLVLNLSSSCVWSSIFVGGKPSVPVELVSAVVHRVDNQSFTSVDPIGFTIYWNILTNTFQQYSPNPLPTLEQDLDKYEGLLFAASQEDQSGSSSDGDNLDICDGKDNCPSTSDHSTVGEIESLRAQIQTNEELVAGLLRSIQSDKDRLEQQIKGSYASSTSDQQIHFSSCDSVSCYVKGFYQKSKDCIHYLYERVVTMISSEKKRACSYASASPELGGKVLMDSTKCDDEKSRPDSKTYELITEQSDYSDDEALSEPDTTSSTPRPSLGDAPARETFIVKHKSQTVLGVVLSLLCMTCLVTLLHRKCCSPRAKADRAARCEQWRTERAYRKAARKQAWKDWWANFGIGFGRCLCCGGRQEKITDYEEKRALILQQEQVLEDVMQSEIRHLQRSSRLATDSAVMAEEGRVPIPGRVRSSRSRGSRRTRANTAGSEHSDSSSGESLPSYRSRSSTGPFGRPPSYRAVPQMMQVPAPRPSDDDLNYGHAPFVVDGFFNYSPTRNAGFETRSASPASDITPDSSVIALSPRGSSETLRTERSL